MKVSKKGQIVIPVHLRERLDISSGDEVKFSIRGQVLQVEIVHDVIEDINYLQNKKGQLGEEDLDENSIGEIIKDLLCQQFYNGNDLLTDRVGRREYKIRGADSIVRETIDIMVHASRHWLEGNYVTTFHELADIFELDFAAIISRFNDKLRGMEMGGPSMLQMMGGEVIVAMVVGEVLTQFRTRVGDETQEKIIREAEILGYSENLGDETVEEKVISSLADKYSILMNLRVLRELARVSIKSIGQRKFEKISKELLAEFDNMTMPTYLLKRKERREKKKKQRSTTDDKETEIIKEPVEKEITKEISEGEEADSSVKMPEMPDFDF